MVVTLYHGSEARIERPVFGVGNPANDYGLGFYCTLDRDLACEWAVAEYRSGFANRYELETDGLTILDLNAPEYCTLHWLAVLVENREFDMKYPQQRMAAEYRLFCIIGHAIVSALNETNLPLFSKFEFSHLCAQTTDYIRNHPPLRLNSAQIYSMPQLLPLASWL